MAWIAGYGPGKIDVASDEELSTIVVQLVKDIYKNTSIPEPTAIIRYLISKVFQFETNASIFQCQMDSR